MSEQAIILLHNEEDIVVDVAFSDLPQSFERVPLSEVVEALRQYELTIFVPSVDVWVTTVVLPKLSYSKQRQALPYLLEEQLANDIDDNHFAILNQSDSQNWVVAVVQRSHMERWTALFAEYELTPARLLPMFYALPVLEDGWSILRFDDTVVVRETNHHGFACDRSNWPTLLEQSLQACSNQLPHRLNLYGELNDFVEEVPCRHYDLSEPIVEWILEQNAPVPDNHLCQGEFAVLPARSWRGRLWWLAGGMTGLWMLITIMLGTISLHHLHAQVDHVNHTITSLYKKIFPQASTVVAPRFRIQQRLDKISHDNSDGFLLLLSRTGIILQHQTAIRLQAISFSQKRLQLSIRAKTVNNFQSLTNALQASGLSVIVRNTQRESQGLRSDLLISL